MQLEISPKAAADIEEIGDYIAEDNPVAAEALVDRFWAEIDLIERRPLIAEGLPGGIRSARVGQYRILAGRRAMKSVSNASSTACVILLATSFNGTLLCGPRITL